MCCDTSNLRLTQKLDLHESVTSFSRESRRLQQYENRNVITGSVQAVRGKYSLVTGVVMLHYIFLTWPK